MILHHRLFRVQKNQHRYRILQRCRVTTVADAASIAERLAVLLVDQLDPDRAEAGPHEVAHAEVAGASRILDRGTLGRQQVAASRDGSDGAGRLAWTAARGRFGTALVLFLELGFFHRESGGIRTRISRVQAGRLPIVYALSRRPSLIGRLSTETDGGTVALIGRGFVRL
jgi:hypothetical protein